MRWALLACALLCALGAGLRAWSAGRRVLAAVSTISALACMAFGSFADAPPFVKGAAWVYAVNLLGKTLAMGRSLLHPLGVGRGLAALFLYPGLDLDRAFLVREPAGARAVGRAALGLLEVALAFGFAAGAREVGLLDAGTWPAAWARAGSFVLLLDGLLRFARGALRVAGFDSEEVFRDPWRMSDLADFWARRWNRFVATTLTIEVYGPVRRRAGRAAGVLAALLASGVLHEAIFRIPDPRGDAPSLDGRYTAFFLVQGVALLVLERAKHARPGGALTRRVAAWMVLLASAPLFFGGAYPYVVPLEDAIRW